MRRISKADTKIKYVLLKISQERERKSWNISRRIFATSFPRLLVGRSKGRKSIPKMYGRKFFKKSERVVVLSR